VGARSSLFGRWIVAPLEPTVIVGAHLDPDSAMVDVTFDVRRGKKIDLSAADRASDSPIYGDLVRDDATRNRSLLANHQ